MSTSFPVMIKSSEGIVWSRGGPTFALTSLFSTLTSGANQDHDGRSSEEHCYRQDSAVVQLASSRWIEVGRFDHAAAFENKHR